MAGNWTEVAAQGSRTDKVAVQRTEDGVFVNVTTARKSENGRNLGVELTPREAGELIGALFSYGADLRGLPETVRRALVESLNAEEGGR